MIPVGFTGTQDGMTREQKETVREALKILMKVDANVVGYHGDCIGADNDFDAICVSLKLARHIYPSTLAHKRAHSEKRTGSSAILYPPKQPLLRNRDIVVGSHVLLAAPSGVIEEMRSGTWATIRTARKLNRSTYVIGPNGFWRLDGPPFPLLPEEL